MHLVSFLLITVAFLSGLWAPAWADTDLEVARGVFEGNCARCHGVTGAGDGPDAKRMFPRPRKLSEGIFKFRTTASGTPPADEDLFRTISTGLPGSRMPDFQRLPEETRMNLVAYVKSLSPVFKEQKPEPLDLGKDPGSKQAKLDHGKELYAQLGCAACHGESGRANGPSAPTLVDNWGNPIRAADLTQGWNYRAGSSPKEIVARVLTGIDGTPMPSYADAISSKEDAWHLAYYIQSLQEVPRWNRTVEAVQAAGALPAAPDDPRWREIPRTDLRLSSNFYKGGEIQPTTVTAISVQAMYNEKEILFRLAWHDPSESKEAPADGIALIFLSDPKMKWRTGSLRVWPANKLGESQREEIASWSAAGTALRPLEYAASPLEGEARYEDGQWTLLARRLRQGAETMGFGIMVWDGENGEEGLRRANSNWVDLVLK